MMQPELFIGVTTWNSELFIDACLSSIKENTRVENLHVCVLDNVSEDETPSIVQQHDVEMVSEKCTFAEAYNRLLDRSKARHTLLMHADTILLSPEWYSLCRSKLTDSTILVSPEDIGCGPMTRTFGAGHPESSFMFFDTAQIKKQRSWRVLKRRFRIPYKIGKRLNLYGAHLTHGLNQQLQKKNKSCELMQVHASNRLSTVQYRPSHTSKHWLDELAYLEYGLGNFYSIDGNLTHYHNWYDRVQADAVGAPEQGTTRDGSYPINFVREFSTRFLSDMESKNLNIPPQLKL